MVSIEVTSERQVTLPTQVLEALGVEPGDRIELHEHEGGLFLRPRKKIRLEKLGTLKVPQGTPPFDIHKFREDRFDYWALRE